MTNEKKKTKQNLNCKRRRHGKDENQNSEVIQRPREKRISQREWSMMANNAENSERGQYGLEIWEHMKEFK